MEKRPEIRTEGVGDAKTPTSIVEEVPSRDNPYLAEDVRTHGYSVRELAGRVTFTDLLFLTLRGDLPTRAEVRLFDAVLVALSPLGPRHPAVRAAMYASVSKTVHPNLLPVGLSVLAGAHLGSEECYKAMKFLRRSLALDPAAAADASALDADGKAAPGFGTRFNGRDPLPAHFLSRIARRKSAGAHLRWADRFSRRLAKKGAGALATGLAAAAFLDLGFSEAQGCGVFQLAAAPQIIALSSEIGTKGLGAMPFLPDSRYEIVKEEG